MSSTKLLSLWVFFFVWAHSKCLFLSISYLFSSQHFRDFCFIYFSLPIHIFFLCYIVGFYTHLQFFYFCSFSAVPISFIFPLPISHYFTHLIHLYQLLFLLVNSSLGKKANKLLPLLCPKTKENIGVKNRSSCIIYQINADLKLSFRYCKHQKHRDFWVDINSYPVLSQYALVCSQEAIKFLGIKLFIIKEVL